jgi:hypothetical protein
MTISPGQLNYEDDKSSLPLVLSVSGCQDVDFTLTPSDSWIVPIPNDGTIPADEDMGITVRILRNQLQPGRHSGQLVISSSLGQAVVPVSVEVPTSGVPGGLRTP